MKRKKNAGKGRSVGSAELFCLVMLSFLINGCSYHDKQFSYFNMLDEKKRTVSNKKAAEKFWSSVRPVSTLSDSHYRLALHYQRKGEHDKAIKEFSKALRNDSAFCKAHNGIAMTYDALRRCEDAHASYGRALQCAPDQAYVYNNYACSSLLCGNYGKGIELLLKAEQLAGDNVRIKNNLRIAQKLELHTTLPEYLSAGQEPVPVTEPHSLLSSPESEKTIDAAVYALPKESIQVAPQDGGMAENKTETSPPPQTAESTGQTAETVIAAASIPEYVPAEQVPVPATEPQPQPSLPESEKTIDTAVYAMPEESNQAAFQNGGIDEIKTETHPPQTAESTGKTAETVIAAASDDDRTVTLVAERNKKIVLPRPAQSLLDQAKVAIEISNGNGATGMAGRSAAFLRNHGFKIQSVTNARHFRFEESTVFYKEGYLEAAKEIAATIPGAQHLEKVDSFAKTFIGVRVVLGKDLVAMRFPEGFSGIAGYSGHKTEQLLASKSTATSDPVQY